MWWRMFIMLWVGILVGITFMMDHAIGIAAAVIINMSGMIFRMMK